MAVAPSSMTECEEEKGCLLCHSKFEEHHYRYITEKEYIISLLLCWGKKYEEFVLIYVTFKNIKNYFCPI